MTIPGRSDNSCAWTDVQNAGLSWREAGSGTPVIFLHGLGGARMAWGPQLRALADQFRCIAWDMPGYGHAEPIRPLTYEVMPTEPSEFSTSLRALRSRGRSVKKPSSASATFLRTGSAVRSNVCRRTMCGNNWLTLRTNRW